jgi:tetratricopeptide (TPR) repeat protein
MAKPNSPHEQVTELIRRGMRKEGCDPRQITNALKLWRSFAPKIAENLDQPALWAAAVELAVARLELEDEAANSRIARKYGVKHRDMKARCDEIWRQLKIKPFDVRFCTMPQILADMIMGDEELMQEMQSLAEKAKKSKQPKEPAPASSDLPPPQLDDFVSELIANPEDVYEDCDHIADLALDWYEEHGLQSTQKLLSRVINHFGSQSDDGVNVDITADALVALGEVLQSEKNHAGAIPLFRRAADIHGDYPGALDDLAESHFALGQFVEAIAAWREELELEEESSHCYHRIAEAYERLGQHSGMVATLEEIVRRFPGDIRALDRLRGHWTSTGETARAESCRQEILAVRAPKGIDDITVWVKYQLDAGRIEHAMKFLNRFEQELGENIELRVYQLKAVLLLARRKTEEVLNEIRRARALPNFCEHCWGRDLEVIAARFGKAVAEEIQRLSALT